MTAFKEILREGMIKNFETSGDLTPIMFFYKGGQPVITEIPNAFLMTPGGKVALANIIKKVCTEPDTMMAGIIIEAYGAKLSVEEDSDLTDAVINGEKRVSELNEKQDIIVMISSTPEGEEMISYIVDPETKTVGEEFSGIGAAQIAGTFSHFFSWNKN